MPTVAEAIQVLFPTSVPNVDWVVTQRRGTTSITAWNLPDPQPSQAELDAVTEQQVADLRRSRMRTNADSRFEADEETVVVSRAVLMTMLDEINVLRQWCTTLRSHLANASSLADQRSRVSGMPQLPDRTTEQARTAVRNKISSGGGD